MISLRQAGSDIKRRRRMAYVVALFVLGVGAYFGIVPPDEATPIVVGAVAPVSHSKGIVLDAFYGVTALIRSKTVLVEENLALRRELSERAGAEELARTLSERLHATKSDFGKLNKGERNLVADVVAKPNSSFYGSFIIGTGKSDGVASGDLVFSPGGIPIGTIKEVYAEQSLVTLFTFAERVTIAELGDKGVTVQVFGLGASSLLAEVPYSMDVMVGDLLTLPDYPEAPIGIVDRIGSRPNDSFKALFIRVPVNASELSVVGVRVVDPKP